MGNFWRTPNSHETELIIAWVRKAEKDARPVEYLCVVFFAILSAAVSFFIFRGEYNLEDAVFYGLMLAALLTSLLFVSLRDSYRKRQITRGDYQLRDSVVRSKQSIRWGRTCRIHYIKVKISGADRNVIVSKTIYKAVAKNSRGFLLRYGKKASKQNGKIQDFFPASRTDDYAAKNASNKKQTEIRSSEE